MRRLSAMAIGVWADGSCGCVYVVPHLAVIGSVQAVADRVPLRLRGASASVDVVGAVNQLAAWRV